MGLAPYGEPKYTKIIKDKLIDIKEDGTFRLNIDFFKYHRGFRMTSNKFHKLFKAPPRKGRNYVNSISYGFGSFYTGCH